MKVSELNRLVRAYGVDVDAWSKTPKDLIAEVSDGSCRLEELSTGIIRHVRVAVVFCTADWRRFLATRPKSNRYREWTMTEKLHIDEPAVEGAVRGICEETGLERSSLIEISENAELYTEKEEDSHSYPGIVTKYRYHVVIATMDPKVTIPPEHCEPQGKENWVGRVHIDELGGPHRLFVDLVARSRL